MSKDDYRANDPQRTLFKKRRAGVVLTRTEVQEIKAGRKKLKADMKAAGAYSRKEFELTASSLGLYFDKNRRFGLLLWLLHGRALWFLLGAVALFLAALYGFSIVTELRGHFTINLTDEMFKEGFELSDTADFKNPSSRLYGIPVEDAPCISITDLPADINEIDGSHNGRNYFAHTFYIAKRGEGTVDYRFTLSINSESMNASKAIWVMLFMDDQPIIFARENGKTGEAECLPPQDNDRFGYREIPFMDNGLSEEQYEIIDQTTKGTYYRLIPRSFAGKKTVTDMLVTDVEEDEQHKYTVVIWLEGDDPDCTNDLIGSHIGMQMDFELIDKDQ